MTTSLQVNNTLQKSASAVLLQPTPRRLASNATQEKTTASPRSDAGLNLPEDIVTLSSTSRSSTVKKESQPVTPDEKRALLDPNVSFSVYG